jgi:hypothetical protein
VWVRVAHERLLSAWPPLAEALARAHTALDAARGVEDAADAWRAAGRRDSYLWEDDRLTITSAALGIPDGKAAKPPADGAANRPTGGTAETHEPARGGPCSADHESARRSGSYNYHFYGHFHDHVMWGHSAECF